MNKEQLQLSTGLGLGTKSCIAFVGAGGKTSAIRTLSNELSQEYVFITTTTHFGIDQVGFADFHWTIDQTDDLKKLGRLVPGRHIFTGPVIEKIRWGGLSNDSMKLLFEMAGTYNAPLLIEADGARRMALKAPAEHEPVIPKFVNTVIVCCGLSILEKPFSKEYVHRIEYLKKIIEKDETGFIDIEDLVKVLTSEIGGLKSIPQQARRILLLNQFDSLKNLSEVEGVVPRLLNSYSSIAVCSLQTKKTQSIYKRIIGVILAAGESKRFGKNKLVELWDGKPIIRYVAEKLMASNVYEIFAVVGHQFTEVIDAINDIRIKPIHNTNYPAGQGTSVSAAIRNLPDDIGGVIFLLGDQPQISTSLINALIKEHANSLSPIIAPYYNNQRGNPVLFDRKTFEDLAELGGDQGGKVLFDKFGVTRLEWHDDTILRDIDRQEDLEEL